MINGPVSLHKNVSLVAISLDDDKTAYTTAIKKHPSTLHSCDYKKWESAAVSDYYIYCFRQRP